MKPRDPAQLLDTVHRLVAAGRPGDAEQECRALIASHPDSADAHNELGLLLRRRGQLPLAAECFRNAIALEPGRENFLMNLGGALLDSRDYSGALKAYSQAISDNKDNIAAKFNQGIVFTLLERLSDAERVLREIIRDKPGFFPAWFSLGQVLMKKNQPQLAVEVFRRATILQPRNVDAVFELGCALQCCWRRDAAIDAFRVATKLEPAHSKAWDNFLTLSLYSAEQTEQSEFENSQTWFSQVFANLDSAPYRFTEQQLHKPPERLRVGFLSPDFKRHSCSFFLKPLFSCLDRTRIELLLYANVTKDDRDEDTAWFQASADQWRDVSGLTDSDAANQIHADSVDILVDLAGHTKGGRLGILARKPAPVQVSWLGYPATTGLPAIDYRLTDSIADPETGGPGFHAEKLLRLRPGFLCYWPQAGSPEVSALPARNNGFVTFGSFNNLLKVTPDVIDAWSAILTALPQSRLILKGWLLDYSAARRRIAEAFASHGISEDRIRLIGWLPRARYLNPYHDVDIGLDPFPYNGTTTTFEALWMGVPVVTLLGNRHRGRVGASIMTRLGRDESIARTPCDYVDTALKLARQVDELAVLRATLRQALERSDLCDGPGFARAVESAFRDIWTAHSVLQ